MEKGKRVLVTTTDRAVFVGTLKENDAPGSVTLTDARNVIRWSAECGGLHGIGATGPAADTRLGAVATEIRVFSINSYQEVTDEAAAAIDEWPVWKG